MSSRDRVDETKLTRREGGRTLVHRLVVVAQRNLLSSYRDDGPRVSSVGLSRSRTETEFSWSEGELDVKESREEEKGRSEAGLTQMSRLSSVMSTETAVQPEGSLANSGSVKRARKKG